MDNAPDSCTAASGLPGSTPVRPKKTKPLVPQARNSNLAPLAKPLDWGEGGLLPRADAPYAGLGEGRENPGPISSAEARVKWPPARQDWPRMRRPARRWRLGPPKRTAEAKSL